MNAPKHREIPASGRTAILVRDPYQMERILGVVLWVGFFLVLFSLGE